jgi:hypothetical protein
MPDPVINKQSAYEALRAENYPFLIDYNTQNPPRSSIEEAEKLEAGYHEWMWVYKVTGSVALISFVAALPIDTSRNLYWPFEHYAAADLQDFLYFIATILAITALVTYLITKKSTVPQRAAALRKPLPLQTISSTNLYSCAGIKIRVTLIFESSRHFTGTTHENYPSSDPFLKALDHKLPITIQRLFDGIAFKNPASDQSHNSDLRYHLEHALLPAVCSICHDFQPAVFRYTVSVGFPQATDDGIMPIGDQF